MQKTNIEWVKNPDGTQGYSWNPIKGLCPVDCKTPDGKSYCYARKMYKRFKWDPKIRIDKELFSRQDGSLSPSLCVDVMFAEIKPKSKIFLCSTFELFHSWIPREWRDAIFEVIKYESVYTFQILTKFPENIDRPMPDNVHLGISLTGANKESMERELAFRDIKARIKFISFEPILQRIGSFLAINVAHYNWIIFGKLTGHGHKHDPEKDGIENVVNYLKTKNIPVFIKDNLLPIMGKEYIMRHREFPEEK